MRLVVIESPFAGEGETADQRERDAAFNARYMRACMLDSLRRGEAPFASHAIYTQVLDDDDPKQRAAGIDAGFAWRAAADATVFYTDIGCSLGMLRAYVHCVRIGHPVERRLLPSDLMPERG